MLVHMSYLLCQRVSFRHSLNNSHPCFQQPRSLTALLFCSAGLTKEHRTPKRTHAGQKRTFAVLVPGIMLPLRPPPISSAGMLLLQHLALGLQVGFLLLLVSCSFLVMPQDQVHDHQQPDRDREHACLHQTARVGLQQTALSGRLWASLDPMDQKWVFACWREARKQKTCAAVAVASRLAVPMQAGGIAAVAA